MTDGIYGIGYGNTSGVGGGYYPPQNNNSEEPENNANNAPVNNYEDTQVDPNRVMDFLARNNYFMPVKAEAAADVNGVDAETQDRIAGYMERFEEIFAIIEEEFGFELAPRVMDVVMDKLLGTEVA